METINNKKLLVALPVKEINDLFLNECLYSIAQQKYPVDLLILLSKDKSDFQEILKSVLDKPTLNITDKNAEGVLETKTIVAEGKINYEIQLTESDTFNKLYNEAFNYANTNGYELYSVIEGEDVIDIDWYSNVVKYADKKSDIHGFLPLSREVSKGGFVGFFNEACWSENLGVEVAGIFDLQLLMRFNCMNLTGAALRTEAIKEYSESFEGDVYKPIKENIKLNYMYEFFLRMVYNDIKFFSIPRIGYEHRIDFQNDKVDLFSTKIPREISSIPKEKGGMDVSELKFWNEIVKKEYFFDKARNVVYNAPETTTVSA